MDELTVERAERAERRRHRANENARVEALMAEIMRLEQRAGYLEDQAAAARKSALTQRLALKQLRPLAEAALQPPR